MRYEIQSKNDLSGVTLVTRFPEEDLDRKALYTIQADRPDFLIPFHCRHVDGQVECSYQLEQRGKLQYQYGTRSPREYIDFWGRLLQPLLDCDDWFLKSFSFVLDPQYLYAERNGDICFLYIPTVSDCSTYDDLKGMVKELSTHNSVSDPKLENQVLHMIIQDFQPAQFLRELRAAKMPDPVKVQPVQPPVPGPTAGGSLSARPEAGSLAAEPDRKALDSEEKAPGGNEIVIDLDGGGKVKKESGKGLFGIKKEKPKQEKRGLFGGKLGKVSKEQKKEIFLGSAAEEQKPVYTPGRAEQQPQQVWMSDESESGGLTQLDEGADGPCLFLASTEALPGRIPVQIEPGRAFTIGRFDVEVGHKQSDFEFDKLTKAVSRRHAAIERDEKGYFVVDLSSRAGTFVNGERLTPNVPCRLTQGCRICFGTGGADYTWME